MRNKGCVKYSACKNDPPVEAAALLIDFDGTLVESRAPEDGLLVELGRKYAGTGDVDISDFEKYRGCGLRELFVHVMKDKGVADYGTAGSACAVEYSGRFDEILEMSRLINPCTAKIIGALRTEKMKVAIVSSAENGLLGRASRYFGIEREFDLIIGREGGEKTKPEPDVYLKAVSALGVNAKDAIESFEKLPFSHSMHGHAGNSGRNASKGHAFGQRPSVPE